MSHHIVILGGGTGGTLMANRLRRLYTEDEAEITVADPNDPYAIWSHCSGTCVWTRSYER